MCVNSDSSMGKALCNLMCSLELKIMPGSTAPFMNKER